MLLTIGVGHGLAVDSLVLTSTAGNYMLTTAVDQMRDVSRDLC